MITLTDTMQQKLGIEGLSPEQQQQLLVELEELLQTRVTADLLDTLDGDAADTLRRLMESGGEEEVDAFFEKCVAENKEVVDRAMNQVIKEFKQASEAIGLS
ncbi:MAG: DUF5663 domain-containing protein [Candidatus Paceibacterota bacterium]